MEISNGWRIDTRAHSQRGKAATKDQAEKWRQKDRGNRMATKGNEKAEKQAREISLRPLRET